MRLAVMQPYFFPYIGYFQLMYAVDAFVVYDNIKFSKGGWIKRNRILVNGKDRMISLPLRADSDYLDICQRRLADSFDKDRLKILRQIEAAYLQAPFFAPAMEIIERCLYYEERNLFLFLLHSLLVLREYLNIDTDIIVSSDVPIDHDLKRQERVLAICQALAAEHYINAIGGVNLYSKEVFAAHGIALSFIRSIPRNYPQFDNNVFISHLSVIDAIMFNGKEQLRQLLGSYELF